MPISRVGDDKPVIQRSVGGTARLTPVVGIGPTGVQGVQGVQGPPGPGTGAGAWVALTGYTANQVVQAPDGSIIYRLANGTSRASFDATEAALWGAVSSKSGTIENAARTAAYGAIAYVDVADFTSDTQDQIDAMALDGGGTLDVTIGSATLTGTILLKEGVRLRGRSKGSTEISWAGDWPAFASATPLTRSDNVELSNLYLDRAHAAPTTPLIDLTGISFSTLEDLSLRQTTAKGTSVGVLLGASTYYNNIRGVQVRGVDTGFMFEDEANGNRLFGLNGVYSSNYGYIIDNSNSNALVGATAETLDITGFILRNGSRKNSLITCRAEAVPTCYSNPYQPSTPAFDNYLIANLAYEAVGGTRYDINHSNVVIKEDTAKFLSDEPAYWTYVAAYKTGAQASLSVSTWVKVTFTGEITDNLSEYASSTFTAAAAGIYHIDTAVLFNSSVAGTLMHLAIKIDSVTSPIIARKYAATTSPEQLFGSISVPLAAGQTVEVMAQSDTASVGLSSGDDNTYLRISRQQ